MLKQTLKFVIDGKVTEVEIEDGRTILDLALIAGLKVPYECMEGSCGTCQANVDGQRVRTCQTLPSSNTQIVNFDEG